LTTSSQAILEVNNVTRLTIANLELKNTGVPTVDTEPDGSRALGAYGVHVVDSMRVSLKGLKIHDIARNAIQVSGSGHVVEDNEVYQAVLVNRGGRLGERWPSAVSTWRQSDGALSQNVSFRRNRIHEVWGECLIALHLEVGVIEGNDARDCFSTNLYVDNATRIDIKNNMVSATTDIFNKSAGAAGSVRATGISISTEDYREEGFAKHESGLIDVFSNIIIGVRVGVAYRNGVNIQDSHGRIRIAHNTILPLVRAGQEKPAIEIDPTDDSGQTSILNQIANNILRGAGGLWIAPSVRGSWRVERNLFERLPQDHRANNLQGDPLIVNPTTEAGPFGFRLRPGSPAVGAGLNGTGATTDFFELARHQNAPTIGAMEDSPRSWVRRNGTAEWDEGTSVAVDRSGNVFAGGSTRGVISGSNRGASDAVLFKYNNAGSVLWSRQAGSSAYDFGMAVAVDELGNAYLAGQTAGAIDSTTTSRGGNDAFLIKYLQNGTKAFALQIGTPSNEGARGVAVEGGNVIVVGQTYGRIGAGGEGNGDAFIAKYSWGGTLKWTVQLGSSAADAANAVTTDSTGNIYVAGSTRGTLPGQAPNAGGEDFFVAKFQRDGALLWIRQMGGQGDDLAEAVTVGPSGSVFASGHTRGGWFRPASSPSEGVVVKYDAAGNQLWGKQLGPESAHAIAFSSGLLAVGGWTSRVVDHTSYGVQDAFIQRLMDSYWGSEFDGVQFNYGEFANVRGLRIAPDGSPVSAGHYTAGSDQGIFVRMGFMF
jgi:hypothetical protein